MGSPLVRNPLPSGKVSPYCNNLPKHLLKKILKRDFLKKTFLKKLPENKQPVLEESIPIHKDLLGLDFPAYTSTPSIPARGANEPRSNAPEFTGAIPSGLH